MLFNTVQNVLYDGKKSLNEGDAGRLGKQQQTNNAIKELYSNLTV